MTTFYIALWLLSLPTLPIRTTVEIFATPQAACESVAKVPGASMTVLKVEYKMDNIAACCDSKYTLFGFQAACKKDAEEYGCFSPKHSVTRMRCISSPSFRVEEVE